MRVAGRTVLTGDPIEVRSPFDGSVVTRTTVATPHLVDEAVLAAVQATAPMAAMPGNERAQRLIAVADAVAADAASLAELLSRETGKTIRESRVELVRSEGVVRLCAEEATRIKSRQDYRMIRIDRIDQESCQS